MDVLYKNELTQEEFELYSTYLKHIQSEQSALYFCESFCQAATSTAQQSNQPIKHSVLEKKLDPCLGENPNAYSINGGREENTQQNQGLACYLTLGFVNPGKNKIIPMNFCIFTKADFFKVYDRIPNVTHAKIPQMRLLTKPEQDFVERKILLLDGPQTLDAVKKTGIYTLSNMHMFDEILRNSSDGDI